MAEWSEFWWESITGPKNLSIAVAHALYDKGNVCFMVPVDLPWRSKMRGCIENEMHQSPEMESFCVDFIDVNDECSDVDDVGRYILERYAHPSIAAGYRGREKIQKYIVDNHVLDNRVLWVKGMNLAQERKWLQFCKEFIPSGEPDGRFVLEMRWSDKENERRNLAVIQYQGMINSHDLSLFNSIYLNRRNRGYSPIWQQYVAVLCALLCNTDAETSLALMEACDFMAQEPIIGIRNVANDNWHLRRDESNKTHILSAVRDENHSVIGSLIWKAQLQVIFPLLEIERVSFIERYHGQVEEALHENYCDNKTGRAQRIYQFGEPIDDPADAELGTIHRMTKLRRDLNYCQYLLHIPNDQSRARIDLLHDLRNALAHGKACPVEKVANFINGHPYVWD